MDRKNAHRISRREFLRVSAMASASLVAAACAVPAAGPASQAPAPEAPAAPESMIKRGGPTLIARQQPPKILDAHLDTGPHTQFWGQIHDSLLHHRLVDPETGTFELAGALAESWERDGDTAWIFHLREGVKFHDGSDWNADVAQWNLLRMRDHPQSVAKDVVAEIESIDSLDSHSIRVNLTATNAAFPHLMAYPASNGRTRIISKQAVEEMGDDEYAQHPVGTGPFKFVEWVKDDHITVERFDGYWQDGEDGQSLPYLDSIRFDMLTDYTVAFLRLRSGDMHLSDIDPKDWAAAQGDPNLMNFPVAWAPTTYALGLNAQNGKFADNIPLRKALAHAIPYDDLTNALGFGLGFRSKHFWPNGGLGYDDALPYYDYDPDKAKELLNEAGYPDGVDLVMLQFNRSQDLRTGLGVQAAVRELGIRIELDVVDVVRWREAARTGEGWDLNHNTRGWSPDPSGQRRQLLTTGYGNFVRSTNTEIDDLMAKGQETFDPNERHEIYRQIQEKVYEDALWLFIYAIPKALIFPKELSGVSVEWSAWSWNGASLHWTP